MRKLFLSMIFILGLIFVATSIEATGFIANTNTVFTTNSAQTPWLGVGVIIAANIANLQIQNVTVNLTANTPKYVVLINSSTVGTGRQIISWANVTSGVAYFNTTIILNRGSSYCLVATSDGSWTSAIGTSPTFPQNGVALNFTNRCYMASGIDFTTMTSPIDIVDIGNWQNIVSVGLSNGTELPISSYINFTSPTPTSNVHINTTSLIVNVTANTSNSNITNISIRLYNSTNALSQSYNVNYSGLLNYTTANYTFSGLSDGVYYYNATVTSTGANASTETRNITIDTINPIITNVNFTANKTYINKVAGSFNISDANLWSINVSIDGNTYYNISNLTTSLYIYNLSLNANTLKVGQHLLTLTVADGHTANRIESYDRVSTTGNKLEFSKDGTNNIKITASNVADTFKVTQEIDRYVFDYQPKSVTPTYSFTVETEQPANIVYRENTPYKTWIITDKNWIDFYSDTIDNSKTKIVYLDNTKKRLQVTVTNKLEEEIISFKSIGDLNIVQYNYTFYTVNGTVTYSTPVLELQNSTITLAVNITNTTLGYNDVNSTLTYNNTLYSVINKTMIGSIIYFNHSIIAPNVTANTNISFFFNTSVPADNLILYYNQTVNNVIINSSAVCANWTVLNLTIFNEDNVNEYLNNSFEYVFSYWVNPSKVPTQYLNGNISGKSLTICSNQINLGYDIYVQYTADGGYTHRYYLYNQSFTGTTIQDFGGNYNNTAKSKLKVTVKDLIIAENLPDILIKLQRFYPIENVWRTVQMFKTGDYGEAFFDIRESDTDYMLIFGSTDNYIYKTTGSLSFLCTDATTTYYFCDITYLLDISRNSSIQPNLLTNLYFSNVSKKVYLNWTDPTARTSTVRLYVSTFNAGLRTTICNTTQSGSAGGMECDVSTYNGTIQAQVFSTASPERAIVSKWFENYIKTGILVSNVISKDEGLFWSFAIVLICIGAALFSPVAAIIACVFGLVVASLLGLTTIITTSFIIGACIVAIIISLKVRA